MNTLTNATSLGNDEQTSSTQKPRTVPLPDLSKLPTLEHLQRQVAKTTGSSTPSVKPSGTSVLAVNSVKSLIPEQHASNTVQTVNTVNSIVDLESIDQDLPAVHVDANTPVDASINTFTQTNPITDNSEQVNAAVTAAFNEASTEANTNLATNIAHASSNVATSLESPDLEQVRKATLQANAQAQQQDHNLASNLASTQEHIPSFFTPPQTISSLEDNASANESLDPTNPANPVANTQLDHESESLNTNGDDPNEEDFVTRYNNGHLDLPEIDSDFFAEPEPQDEPKPVRPQAVKKNFKAKSVPAPIVHLAPTHAEPELNSQATKATPVPVKIEPVLATTTEDVLTTKTEQNPTVVTAEDPVIFTPASEQEILQDQLQDQLASETDVNTILAKSNGSPTLYPTTEEVPVTVNNSPVVKPEQSNVPASQDHTNTQDHLETTKPTPVADPVTPPVTDPVTDPVTTTVNPINPAVNFNAPHQTTTVSYDSANDLADDYTSDKSNLAVNDLTDLDQQPSTKDSNLNSHISHHQVRDSEPTDPTIDPQASSSNQSSMSQSNENSTATQSQYQVRTDNTDTAPVTEPKAPVRVHRPSVFASSIQHPGDSYDYVHNRWAVVFGIIAFLAVVGLVVYLAYILFKIIW